MFCAKHIAQGAPAFLTINFQSGAIALYGAINFNFSTYTVKVDNFSPLTLNASYTETPSLVPSNVIIFAQGGLDPTVPHKLVLRLDMSAFLSNNGTAENVTKRRPEYRKEKKMTLAPERGRRQIHLASDEKVRA